jgi:aryl-phospho-beta-D-glucosidase BglC (GH1 family)
MAAPHYRADVDVPSLVARIAAAGFRHVRLPWSPALLMDEGHPETLRPDGLKRLDDTLDLLVKCKIAVSVDMHDADARLWHDTAFQDKFVTFWGALAKHLSPRDPKYVLLEVVNEPVCDTPAEWNGLQGRVLAAMRKNAPRLTLVATPNMQTSAGHWDEAAALKTLKPYPDPNIIYTFHYYNPFWFTHQSATWAGDLVKAMRDVPYPSSPEAVARVMDRQQTQEAKDILRGYGDDRWNAARIRADLQPYADWARANHAPIYCGELGVYKAVSPAADRLRWYQDVLAALKADGIPWTIWDDGGGFGVFAQQGDQWAADGPLLKTLGLKQK